MKRFSLLALVLTFATTAFADRVFVEKVRGSGADADRETIEELIRVAVPESGHVVVHTPEEAEVSLSGSLLKLGDSYVLSLQKRNKAGATLFADKMKAGSLSEMDTITARLTRGVLAQQSVARTADVTNITTEETTANSRRYNATRQWVIGLGPGWTSNLNSSGGGFSFVLGFLWGLDPDFSLNLSWTTSSGPKNDESSFNDFSLGGEYYFTRTRHSPFLGARLGYGHAKVNKKSCGWLDLNCKETEDSASGWAGTVTGGMKFFRTSNVNAAVMLNYQQLFDRTSYGHPGLTTLLIAVYF